jgi:hypothetical protein
MNPLISWQLVSKEMAEDENLVDEILWRRAEQFVVKWGVPGQFTNFSLSQLPEC